MAAVPARTSLSFPAAVYTAIVNFLALAVEWVSGRIAIFFGWSHFKDLATDDQSEQQHDLLEEQRRVLKRPISASLGHLLSRPRAATAGARGQSPPMYFPCPGSSAVRVVRGVLDEGECRAFVAAATDLGFSAPGQFSERTRVCERVHTVDPSVSGEMMERLRPFVPEQLVVDGARWRLTRFTHHWRYVRYYKGGHFAPHFDGSKLLPWHEMSMFTVQIYLNSKGSDFEGGDTHFYMDHKPPRHGSHMIVDGSSCDLFPLAGEMRSTASVRPVAGDALIFDHAGRSVFHSGGAVTSGRKYIMRGDILYAAVPEDIPRLLTPALPPAERTWCPETAANLGTRDFTGQVWLCDCAADKHGASCCAIRPESCSNLGISRVDGRRGVCLVIAGRLGAGRRLAASRMRYMFEQAGVRTTQLDLADCSSGAEAAGAAAARQLDEGSADVVFITGVACRTSLAALRASCGASLVPVLIDAADEVLARRGSATAGCDLAACDGWAAVFDNTADVERGVLDEWLQHTVLPRTLVAMGSPDLCGRC